jgi:hypothetical protein
MKIRQSANGAFVALPGYPPEYDNLNSGAGTKVIDWSRGGAQRLILNGNAALNLYSGLTTNEPTWMQLKVKQDSVGSRVPTLPGVLTANAGAALVFSTAPFAVDLLSLYFDGSLISGTLSGLRFQ